MCNALRRNFKYFLIVFVLICIFVFVYYDINGLLDDWMCDYGCKQSEQIPDEFKKEKIAIGIYKKNSKRCDCFVVYKENEWLFREEMERSRYEEKEKKVIDKWIKKLYYRIKLRLKGKGNDRNTSVTPLLSSGNSSK